MSTHIDINIINDLFSNTTMKQEPLQKNEEDKKNETLISRVEYSNVIPGYTPNENPTQNESKEIKLGISKFKNIMGITCYMNSVLHILQNVPIFIEYITQLKFRDVVMRKIEDNIKRKQLNNTDENRENLLKDFVIFELFRLFEASMRHDDTSITPTTFKALIGKKSEIWNEYNHQDSQEFLNFLITKLEDEVGNEHNFIPGFTKENMSSEIMKLSKDNILQNVIAKNSWSSFQRKEYSPLKPIFDGMIQNNSICMCCKIQSKRYEPFLTLPLSVPIKESKDLIKSFDIYELLDEMIKEEQLDSENKINCEMCGLKNQGYKRTKLWKTPKLLVIHIKRFLVNSFGIPTQKITNNVSYPYVDLDLLKYFDEASPYKTSSKYDLLGINIHQAFGNGNNINSGHYTSIIKNIFNNQWYLYNDSHPVKPVYIKEDLQSTNAYMLFYYRQD